MEVRGLYDKTCEYFENEIQPHTIFRELTIEEGIGLAKELIQYAINNEEGGGGDINILVIKPDSVAWYEKADYHQGVFDTQICVDIASEALSLHVVQK